MGFRPAIEKLLRALPPKETRQTLLYSATFPAQVVVRRLRTEEWISDL